MGSNYLCTTQRARHPFFVESIGINIYSAEELCYYLYHYVYLIDETIISERLCDWLGEEIGMEKARALMLRALTHNEGVGAYFQPLFMECGYLTDEEVKHFQEEISQIQVESEDVRRKMKADYLLRFEMYISAISEYEKILEKRTNARLGMQFYADVLENVATAYARLFRFEEAAEYLWESYQSVRSRKTYEKYLQILPLFLSKEKYEQRLEEIRAGRLEAERAARQTENVMEAGLATDLAEELQELDETEMMEEFRLSYVRNTTGTR